MKKSLFERIVYDAPQWLVTTLVYGIGGAAMFLLMFGLPGCTIYEPLPGLCYTDKDGTYICDEGKKRIYSNIDDIKKQTRRDVARTCRQDIFFGQQPGYPLTDTRTYNWWISNGFEGPSPDEWCHQWARRNVR